AVLRFMKERIPFTLRGVSAAHVLDDDDVALRRRAKCETRAVALIVGRALEDHGKAAVHCRPVDIRVKCHAVAHLYRQALHCDRICRDGEGGTCEEQSCNDSADTCTMRYSWHSKVEPF